MLLDTVGKCAYCGVKIEIEEPKEFWKHFQLPICCSKECNDAYFAPEYQKKLRGPDENIR
jgi:hypothetical protein